MATGTAVYPCGCRVTQLANGGGVVSVTVCPDHGHFDSVRRGWRFLTSALEQAHEQFPVNPDPPRAA